MLKGLCQKLPVAGTSIDKTREAEYRFILGKMGRDGQICPYPQSASHTTENGFVLLFPDKQRLLEYIAKKQENTNHVNNRRSKLVDETYIHATLPNPNLLHTHVYASAEIGTKKINRLIETRRKEILKDTDVIPQKSVYIPYESRFNDYIPVLEVNYCV